MQPIKVHELAPPTCVLLLSKNFDPSSFFNVAPSLSMSNFYLSPWCISYLCSNFSPFVINFHKRCASYWYKGLHLGVDGWHLNLVFFMDTTTYVGMTPLVALEIPLVGSFDLDTYRWGTSQHGSSISYTWALVCEETCFTWWSLKVEDHLWNHHLVWLIPRVEVWYHVK